MNRTKEVPTSCSDCGEKLTPEDRLICAIFQEEAKCYECHILSQRTKCTKCKEPIKDEFYYGDKPYHAGCLPYASQEVKVR